MYVCLICSGIGFDNTGTWPDPAAHEAWHAHMDALIAQATAAGFAAQTTADELTPRVVALEGAVPPGGVVTIPETPATVPTVTASAAPTVTGTAQGVHVALLNLDVLDVGTANLVNALVSAHNAMVTEVTQLRAEAAATRTVLVDLGVVAA